MWDGVLKRALVDIKFRTNTLTMALWKKNEWFFEQPYLKLHSQFIMIGMWQHCIYGTSLDIPRPSGLGAVTWYLEPLDYQMITSTRTWKTCVVSTAVVFKVQSVVVKVHLNISVHIYVAFTTIVWTTLSQT